MEIDFTKAKWINKPKNTSVDKASVSITTNPHTDFWQRSYYGFRNDNAPALLLETKENFTFTFKVSFRYQSLFDQCGPVIYLDSENWFKASIEYEGDDNSPLGSVVTNMGYSDWATQMVRTPEEIWYRLSRRGPDFRLEHSLDGSSFSQMRVFHLHSLGETTGEMGHMDPPKPAEKSIRFGIYACSPIESSVTAVFESFTLEPSIWKSHG